MNSSNDSSISESSSSAHKENEKLNQGNISSQIKNRLTSEF